jgi:hypothetical protein
VWSGCQLENDQDETVSFLNNKGTVVSKYFKWDKKGRISSSSNMFTESDKGLLFRPFQQDYLIRELDDNGVVNSKYKVDFGIHSLPDNDAIENHDLNGPFDGITLKEKKYAFSIMDVFETPNYIVFCFHIGSTTFKSFIYSKKHQMSLYCAHTNDDAALPQGISDIGYSDPTSDTFYSYCGAYLVQNYVGKRKEKISNTKNGQGIKSLLNNITVNSNPVIFKLKFNDKFFDNLKH